MPEVPQCVVERWLTAADNHLRQKEPSEHNYILAMMCANRAWEQCRGMFPTRAIISIYRGLCNESFAKEDVALGCWSQAIFSTAAAVECYLVAKGDGSKSWEEEAAGRGLLRCRAMRKQVLEAIEMGHGVTENLPVR
ncbi:hypothetical protein LEL_02128 [Akanthomyces lecanii RCEF 1005]|uniref:Uncharacterized protein n=1 Tax=Akanthomyces lecanii RCEF 1005 TaxID=1081108 RepID=A0A168L1L0_CORDF|nr:hypothetical protein LEL_02128 [Akanthomyces lecanii RCEF 1005]